MESDIDKYETKLRLMLLQKLPLIDNIAESQEINEKSESVKKYIVGQEIVYNRLQAQGIRYKNLINATQQLLEYFVGLEDKVKSAVRTARKSKNNSVASKNFLINLNKESDEWSKNKTACTLAFNSSGSSDKNKNNINIINSSSSSGENLLNLSSDLTSKQEGNKSHPSNTNRSTRTDGTGAGEGGSRANTGIIDGTSLRSPGTSLCSVRSRGRDSLVRVLHNVLVNGSTGVCDRTYAKADNGRTDSMCNDTSYSTYDDTTKYPVGATSKDGKRGNEEKTSLQERTHRETNNPNLNSISHSTSTPTLMRIKKDSSQSLMSVRTSITNIQQNDSVSSEKIVFLSDVQAAVIRYIDSHDENEREEVRDISSIRSLVDSLIENFRKEQLARDRLGGIVGGDPGQILESHRLSDESISDLNNSISYDISNNKYHIHKKTNTESDSNRNNNHNSKNNIVGHSLIVDQKKKEKEKKMEKEKEMTMSSSGIIVDVKNILKDLELLQDSKRKTLTSLFSEINEKISYPK